jgi:hypothetical protein
LQEAVTVYNRVVDVFAATYGPSHRMLAPALASKIIALQGLGGVRNLDEAVRTCDRFIDIGTAALGSNHPDVALTLTSKATAGENAKSINPDRRIRRRPTASGRDYRDCSSDGG